MNSTRSTECGPAGTRAASLDEAPQPGAPVSRPLPQQTRWLMTAALVVLLLVVVLVALLR